MDVAALALPDRRKRTSSRARLRSAMEFLTSIPLGTHPAGSARASTPFRESEASVGDDAHEDATQARGKLEGVSGKLEASGSAAGELGDGTDGGVHGLSGAVAGGQGPAEVYIRVRGHTFRHISSRGQRETALFQDAIAHADVMSSRIFFSRNKDYPSAVFSVIRYDSANERAYLKERAAAAASLLLAGELQHENTQLWERWKGHSYRSLLHALFAPCRMEDDAQGHSHSKFSEILEYDPSQLDDPSLDLERQRIPYAGEGYLASILRFRNEKAEKAQLNEKFARTHPWLDFGDGQSLVLSHIRSLKKHALQLWWDHDWEVATVALAVVQFERLVYKRLVNKANRKLAMATCLLLAYKMNEMRDNENATPTEVVTQLEAVFGASRKLLLKAEFPVFVHLGFALKLPTTLTFPHMERLLRLKGMSMQEYLGANVHSRFLRAVAAEEAAAEREEPRDGAASTDSRDP